MVENWAFAWLAKHPMEALDRDTPIGPPLGEPCGGPVVLATSRPSAALRLASAVGS